MTVVLSIVVVLLAAVVLYLLLTRPQAEPVEALTEDGLRLREVEARQRAEEGQRLMEERIEKRLQTMLDAATKQIGSSAGDELKKSAEHLMKVNKEQREAEQETAAKSFEGRKKEFESLTEPISKALKQVEEEVETLSKQRQEADAVLVDQIKGLGEQTGRLGQALRNPKGRGDWGEVQLRRLVELAGMTEHVDFDLQKGIQGAETRLRPDMIVRMPGNRVVTVDSKVSLDALEESQVAENEVDRDAALRKLAGAVRTQVRSLASKDYHGQFGAGQSPDFVICHIRVEAALFGALEAEPTLYEDALTLGVVISTPLTLVALLRTIELGWRTERMADEAQKIAEAGRELHKRSSVFLSHFNKVGTKLDQAVGAYNDAVGSAERNVLPKLRQIEELGAKSNKSLDQPARVERAAKPVVAEELRELETGEAATEFPAPDTKAA